MMPSRSSCLRSRTSPFLVGVALVLAGERPVVMLERTSDWRRHLSQSCWCRCGFHTDTVQAWLPHTGSSCDFTHTPFAGQVFFDAPHFDLGPLLCHDTLPNVCRSRLKINSTAPVSKVSCDKIASYAEAVDLWIS